MHLRLLFTAWIAALPLLLAAAPPQLARAQAADTTVPPALAVADGLKVVLLRVSAPPAGAVRNGGYAIDSADAFLATLPEQRLARQQALEPGQLYSARLASHRRHVTDEWQPRSSARSSPGPAA